MRLVWVREQGLREWYVRVAGGGGRGQRGLECGGDGASRNRSGNSGQQSEVCSREGTGGRSRFSRRQNRVVEGKMRTGGRWGVSQKLAHRIATKDGKIAW